MVFWFIAVFPKRLIREFCCFDASRRNGAIRWKIVANMSRPSVSGWHLQASSAKRAVGVSFKVISEVFSISLKSFADHPSLIILLAFAICFFKQVV